MTFSRCLLLFALVVSLGCATSGSHLGRYQALSPSSKELYDKYHQFMTEGQQDRFLDAATDEDRQKFVADLHVEERLSHYPQYVQDAIWSQEAVAGMDKQAVLLSWGKPDRIERQQFDDSHGVMQEIWFYRRGQTTDADYRVQFVQGVVTAVEKPAP